MTICKILVCDECGDHSDIEEMEKNLLKDCKEDGWKTQKKDGKTEHLCPDCR